MPIVYKVRLWLKHTGVTMSNVILRKRKLGKGSTTGIKEAMQQPVSNVRNFRPKDIAAAQGTIGYLFRWGCTSSLSELGLSAATITVNTSDSIQWCSNKKLGRLAMQEAGVPVPQTWGSAEELRAFTGQVVLRPAQHAQGRNLFTYNLDRGDEDQFDELVEKAGRLGSHYVSVLVNKVNEYRVFIAQNRVVWIAKKTPGNPDQVAWNVAQGGRFDNVPWGEWPKKVVQAAMAAAKVSTCDFCGVDVMVDAEGNPYVLEVNSAPSQTSPYRQQCVAKVFDYIIVHGKDHFGDVPDSRNRTWKSYIHPALWTKGGDNGNILRST